MTSAAIYQATVRFARTLFAAAIAAAATSIPQALGVFNLDGTSFAFVVMILTAGLNGLGKLVRGESVDVVVGAPGDKLPI